MEKLFRLKKEARQFFDSKHKTNIYPLRVWEDFGISLNAIEEVERIYIKRGIKSSESGSTLSGWRDSTTALHFTIEIRGEEIKFQEDIESRYDIADLMNKIQEVCNDHHPFKDQVLPPPASVKKKIGARCLACGETLAFINVESGYCSACKFKDDNKIN